MIQRNLAKDIKHSDPLADLDSIRAGLAGSPMVWHAMILPLAETNGEPRVVVTGHIVCHDCALCVLAGDLRDPSTVAVPWRSVYPDCCDDDGYAGDGFDTYNDAIAGPLQVPVDVAESLRAVLYRNEAGQLRVTGWSITKDRSAKLDEFAFCLPEVAASRPSMMTDWADIAAGETGPVFPFGGASPCP